MEPKKKINPRNKPRPVKPRPKLKARITDEHKPMRVPACPEHSEGMDYNPETMTWNCPVAWCTESVRPVIEKGSEFVILGEGQLELFIAENIPVVGQRVEPTQYYLRAPDNNVMIEITPYVALANIETNSRVHGPGTTAEVTIVLQKITKT